MFPPGRSDPPPPPALAKQLKAPFLEVGPAQLFPLYPHPRVAWCRIDRATLFGLGTSSPFSPPLKEGIREFEHLCHIPDRLLAVQVPRFALLSITLVRPESDPSVADLFPESFLTPPLFYTEPVYCGSPAPWY